ncbi:hypothetical protein TNCT_122551 [Trichonephila clavata]|uniref:Uncharacterized protein n=1 Tax=Trichonephila clavata TaxID=2740835 RepID=A0A8X6G964_TRICU|nr:hypothetical protein TNCT_122551 [Trichonephila clavata]
MMPGFLYLPRKCRNLNHEQGNTIRNKIIETRPRFVELETSFASYEMEIQWPLYGPSLQRQDGLLQKSGKQDSEMSASKFEYFCIDREGSW